MNRTLERARRVAVAAAIGACAAAVGFSLTSCASGPAKVESEHNMEVNFAKYKTFAVLQPSASGPATDPGAAVRLTQPAMQAVRDSMTAKGFTETSRDKADFVIRVRGQSVTNVEVTDWGYRSYPYGVRRPGWGYSPGFSPVDVRQTTDRTLIVEIYDNASKNEAWVGWSKFSGSNPIEPDQLKDAIRNVLARFPPGTGGQ